MKQVIHRKLGLNILHFCLIFLLTFSITLSAQDGDPVKGKALFNANCASCHKLDKKMTGPALRNVEQRLANDQSLDRAWISAWLRNSDAVKASGDPYALKITKEYNGTAMTAYPGFTDQDISDILAHTATVPVIPPKPPTDPNVNPSSDTNSNSLILGALALLFALLAGALFLVNKTLRRFADEKGVTLAEKQKRTPIWKAFVENQFLVLVTAIFFLLAAGYFVYGYFMQVGVNQGYEPVQEIHFSHRIHAGTDKDGENGNGIDCKYCHSSARVSKTSGIPSLNVCMNCHKTISEVADNTQLEGRNEYGVDYNAEIKRLYKAVGWDDAEQKYTGETSPVKWTRIHNLPDFAYFNHSQHVSVAGVECQTCHGPVEQMEVVYQFAPLTMGWCINCHRETNVNIKGNAYYENIHEELSKKYGDLNSIKAWEMGGTECGKCHY